MTLCSTKRLVQLALDHGASHAAVIPSAEIPFAPELRACCVQNVCGRYATSWVGPPAIGEVDDLIPQVRVYQQVLVIQTVDLLEDCFDYPGMVAARERHGKVFRQTLAAVRNVCPDQALLALDVGCCEICPDCTYPDVACRFPEDAVPSIEAYGINVNPMLTACGLKYNNGPDTVSYVGLILFSPTA